MEYVIQTSVGKWRSIDGPSCVTCNPSRAKKYPTVNAAEANRTAGDRVVPSPDSLSSYPPSSPRVRAAELRMLGDIEKGGCEVRTDPNQLRRVILRPYLKGKGPVFTLTTWDTGRRDGRGSTYQRYRLSMGDEVLFQGDDYSPSPCWASDSDEAIGSLLGFLTLRPGDTDKEHFKGYTPAQLDFCAKHAESLMCEAMARFGEL